MAEFFIVPALVMGVVIGLVELFFVHMDEKGLGWLSHGLHALPTAFIFTFIAMNLPFAASLVGLTLGSNLGIIIALQVVIGLVAAFKVKAAAAIVTGRNAVGEKLSHALIVGALIAASPYIWPFLEPFIPTFLTNLG
ncbi:MAG: hypothetical protein ACMXYD_00105 [Candidatus Woesearchaeota archaeon]